MRHRLAPLALAALAALISLAAAASADAETRLLRFPDVHGDQVVFTYAGDLWIASTGGGTARRLTAHPGVELFAKFSPDGRWVAFTGQYDGDEQVYVMPAAGGAPRQLTFYPALGPLPPRWGYDHLVYGWTPDGESVLFRSLRHGWDIGEGRLFVVPREGGLPEPLAMPAAGAGDYSPDGAKVVYSPLFRDFRSWKRYAGGWAQDLWVFDLTSHEATRVTDHPRTDRDPMWVGERIYFVSDRTGTLNLFVHDPATGEATQVTDSTVWDVRWPAAGPEGQIVYEQNGELHLHDTRTGESRALAITVPSDLLAARASRREVGDLVEDFALSPKGERALFVARGDVFSVPAEHGPTRNLTASSGAHDKWARWSPDGSRVAYVSDADGEDEIWLAPAGGGEPVQLTDGGDMFRYAPEWSPDGERIAFSDKEGRLWVVDVASRASRVVADDPVGLLNDFSWSPDGRHLAMTLTDESGFGSIWVWSAGEGGGTGGDGELRRVTEDLFNEFNPAWDPSGDYLYYVADREFAPQIGSFEFNYVVDRESYLVAVALRDDVAHPFPPRSDEVTLEGEDEEEAEAEEPDPTRPTPKEPPTTQRPRAGRAGAEAEEAEGDDEEDDEEGGAKRRPVVRIDWDGLAERVARVPVEADNYGGLAAKEGHLLYVRGGPFYYGRQGDVEPSLRIFSLEDREEKVLAENVQGYALSADGSKVLVEHGGGGGFQLYDAKPGGEDSAKKVSTSGLVVTVEPREEWAQIFDEVWRRFRDFFYVETMHGYDWDGLRERYRPWLAHVAHRSDLNYLISEMISELNVSHAYISGGDYEIPDRPQVALPGARFALDEASGRYRFSDVFRGHDEEPKYRAPLGAIGVDVSPGDYLLAIDGEEVEAGVNPYELLRFKADRPVTLTVNDRPSAEGSREVTYEPVTSEDDLIYLDMVLRNRERVAELSGGRVGYLHLPNMGASGIYEFIKWFYPQIRKEGLVVDVRGNGGGNVSQMLVERLRRDLLAVGFSRNNDRATTYPATVFHGHMAAILNETSASDGDIFPAMFQKAGLGPLVGKRSWGGVIGITNRGPLVDGGSVNVPEFGFASPEGEWIIEGRGVEPDIAVDNDPASVLAGRDPQLERAVREVLDRIESDPKRLPDRPAPPVRAP